MVTSVIIRLHVSFKSLQMSFDEGRSFFSQPYLQGESNSIREDKAGGMLFLGLPSTSQSTSQLVSRVEPTEPKETRNLTNEMDTRRYAQVYLRRKIRDQILCKFKIQPLPLKMRYASIQNPFLLIFHILHKIPIMIYSLS